MRVTLKEVAERAGVSRSAVSRTFTEGAPVSDKTRAKVIKAADELGYRPNVLASSLTTRRTKLIGLVADNLHNPLFLAVIDLFTRLIQERGFRPLLVNLAGETNPANSLRLLQQYSVDGVIVASSTLPGEFAVAFHDAGLPVVHTFGQVSEGARTHVVGVDNVEGGRMAARALLDRGYSRIGALGGPAGATSTRDRLKGFLETLNAAGLDPDITFAEGYSYAAGRKAMEDLVARGQIAEAYFCGDDVLSIGARDALGESGFHVPEDVGLIGFNDMDMAAWSCFDLTTIRQPVDSIIETSVELLLDLIRTPGAEPECRLVPCQTIWRRTLR